jgi:hypothetical protein
MSHIDVYYILLIVIYSLLRYPGYEFKNNINIIKIVI